MKPFLFLLIVLLMGLLLSHFFRSKIKEGLDTSEKSECSASQLDQNDLVYKNAGIIQQQDKTISDFQASVEDEIKDLSDRVTSFHKTITKNATDISNNTMSIKATIRKSVSKNKAKQAEVAKAGAALTPSTTSTSTSSTPSSSPSSTTLSPSNVNNTQ
jgi:hypothetical protein